jgi:hypothetical protein
VSKDHAPDRRRAIDVAKEVDFPGELIVGSRRLIGAGELAGYIFVIVAIHQEQLPAVAFAAAG